MRREGKWLGSAKSKVGWGFLVGLVRECTMGSSGWLPGVNGQNRPRPGKPRLYCIKAGFNGDTRGERERQRRDTDNIIYRGHRIL